MDVCRMVDINVHIIVACNRYTLNLIVFDHKYSQIALQVDSKQKNPRHQLSLVRTSCVLCFNQKIKTMKVFQNNEK